MSQRQVIKERARLFPHPNAGRLELCKVGPFQLVVRRDQYQGGDIIVVAPKDALLPAQYVGLYVNADTGVSYLRGPESNRVASVRLRGEESQGVILPPEGLDDLPFGEDLSEALGISFYEPPIPLHLAGETHSLASVSTANYRHHEVEQFGIYEDEFVPGELVVVTEKLHGTQGVYYRTAEGLWSVTSKGLSQKRLGLKETEHNSYWQAARRTELFGRLDALFPGGEVQVFAEVVPAQKSFVYGQTGPTPFIFKFVLDGEVQPRTSWPEWLVSRSVPVLYAGPYERSVVESFREGQETVSGRNLHIREGVVLTPAQPRRNREGRDLSAKLISAAYAKKETGDELS